MNIELEVAKLIVSIVALVGSGVLAAVAVVSYRRSERWRRAEFLAKEMKEFFDKQKVTNALMFIDWSSRRVPLFEPTNAFDGRVVVTKTEQATALRPHSIVKVAPILVTISIPDLDNTEEEISSTIKKILDGEKSGTVTRKNSDPGSSRYTAEQVAIRDCYDAFLDGLLRISNYLRTDLTDETQLKPYLGYWINRIKSISSSNDAIDAEWTAALFTYVRFYGFQEVEWLFSHFGCDISCEGQAYRAALSKMNDQALAVRLASSVGVEYAPKIQPAGDLRLHASS